MKKENRHVVPVKDKWGVRLPDRKRLSRVFDTKGEAMHYAEKNSRKNNACMVIHNSKGKFSEKDCDLSPNDQHVVPHKNRWAVVTAKKRRAKVFNTKGSALSYAENYSDDNGVCMVIHDYRGKIANKQCAPTKRIGAINRVRSIAKI